MLSTIPVYRWFFTVVGLLLAPLLVGCSGSASKTSDATAEKAAASPQSGLPAQREIWEIFCIQGARVGYGQTTISRQMRSGRELLRVEGLSHLAIKRSQQRTEQDVRFTSIETPDGQLLEFQSEVRVSPVPLRTAGRVAGDVLLLTTTTQGKTTTSSIPWSAEYGGPYATEQSLLRRPMQPGEHRTLRSLVVGFNQVAKVDLSAKDFEPVELLTGTHNLLRIDTAMQFPDGQTLQGALWTDRTGEPLKTHAQVMELESFRATKALALEEHEPAEFDLTSSLSVALDRPIAQAHQTKRIRYRVRLEGGDPAGVFVAGPSQQVQSIDPHTAEVTVYALRPGQPPHQTSAPQPSHEDDLEANNLIQSDDPAVKAMAREAAGDQKDPWPTALALERYVHRVITRKDFSQAFATAAEVAQTREGDCTEHAVLLAALARARGIPARVAIGLVYVEQTQTFGYHMWNELYVERQWIPLDATLALGGIGAAHLKLAQSSLKGASAYSSFLPVVQVAGRLRIEILETE